MPPNRVRVRVTVRVTVVIEVVPGSEEVVRALGAGA